MEVKSFIKLLILQFVFHLVKTNDEFRFANQYGDHMVLQRAPFRSILWGYGVAGATVHIRLLNEERNIYDVYEIQVKEG